jgi:hypothetical protein
VLHGASQCGRTELACEGAKNLPADHLCSELAGGYSRSRSIIPSSTGRLDKGLDKARVCPLMQGLPLDLCAPSVLCSPLLPGSQAPTYSMEEEFWIPPLKFRSRWLGKQKVLERCRGRSGCPPADSSLVAKRRGNGIMLSSRLFLGYYLLPAQSWKWGRRSRKSFCCRCRACHCRLTPLFQAFSSEWRLMVL